MSSIIVREIPFGSDDYKAELQLRQEILRTPLGLTLGGKDTATDDVELHIGAFDGNQLVGVIMLRVVSAAVVQMRQVAVAATGQGRGIGRALVDAFEDRARTLGAREIIMDARVTAQPFYERLGYEATSEPYILSTIPHLKMRKLLR